MIVSRFALVVFVCARLASAAADTPDPIQIVRTAIDLNHKGEVQVRGYALTHEVTERDIGSDGAVKETESKTFEVTLVGGQPYEKLVRRDGSALSPEDAQKEQRKLDQTIRERERESPEQRKSRLDQYEQKLKTRREMLDDLPAAFDFRIKSSEIIDGHDCWIIEATPKAGFQPTSFRTSFLTKVKGEFWISKQHNRLVKVDAVTTAPVRIGWILARLNPGTRFVLEQMRLPDDVWVTKRSKMTYDARIALVKQARGETEHVMWDHRKEGLNAKR